MSVFESMKAEAKALQDEIKELLNMDCDELYGDQRLHDLSFNHKGKEQFKMIFGLIEDLSKCHFDRIPEDKISPIREYIKIYKDTFERAKSLNLNDNSPKNTRDSIVQEVEYNYQLLFERVLPIINFANQTGTDFKQIEREARALVESTKAHSEKQKNQMEEKTKEAETILESMRKAAAETGVSQNAIHYSNSQKTHAEKANKWYKWGQGLLIGLIVFAAIVGISFVMIFKKNEALVLGYPEITILIIISLWIYAINFCNKNFYAEKHNETINANKAKTLTTFLSFVDATEEENIKDQVLLHACMSAFSNPPTGFSKNQSIPLPPTVELTKKIVSRSSENS